MSDKKKWGLLAGILGNVIWGVSYLFTRVAQQEAEPMVQLSIRFLFAFVLLNLMLCSKKFSFRCRGKHLRPLIIIATVEPIYFFCESYGIYYSNSTFAGVALAVVPIIAMGFAALFLREYPTRRQLAISLIPICGVILVTLAGSAMGVVQPLGVLLIAGACVFAALFRVFTRGASAEFSAFERSYAVIGSCALVFTAAALIRLHGDLSAYSAALHSGRFLWATAVLSILCSVAANILVNYSATQLPMAIFSNLGSIITVCAMFMGIIFLHEPINAVSLLGSLMVLGGIWLIAKSTSS